MIVAIIQARMGSTRLPGKMLEKIGEKTVLEYLVTRILRATTLSAVVVATTDRPEDDAIAAIAEKCGATCFRGSEHDVLDRYYKAAKRAKADTVVRLTGDCPFMDPSLVDRVVRVYLKNKKSADYVSNVHPPTFPDGMDVEVFSFTALERAWKEAKLASEREHVTPFLYNHPELFRTKNVYANTDTSAIRLTVDTAEDLALARKIHRALSEKKESFGLQDILTLLKWHPELTEMNRHYRRNEGYTKSVREEGARAIIILGGGLTQDKLGWRTTFLNEGDSFGILGDRLRVLGGKYLFDMVSRKGGRTIILVTGGKGQLQNVSDVPTVASVLAKELVALGVQKRSIQKEERVNTTFEQLREIERRATKEAWSSVTVVSNRYHLPRILAFIEYGPGLAMCKKWLSEGTLSLVSAEDILIHADPAFWKGRIGSAYRSAAMKRRVTREANGVLAIRGGTYRYGADNVPALTLRKAAMKDARFLYDLRNEEAVRSVSFTEDSFSFESHKEWLRRKLTSNDSVLYIAEAEATPVGQVRFDVRSGGNAEVSIAVCEKYRGRGYGSSVIKTASSLLFKAFPNVRNIHAYIKPGNKASHKVFAKAGYREKDTTVVKGKPCVDMLLTFDFL